jgi:hypothetical protein
MKDGRSKLSKIQMALGIGLWLLDAVIARSLVPLAAQLYGPAGDVPFTLHAWWQLVPWLAASFLIAAYTLMFTLPERLTKYHFEIWTYYAFCITAVLYLVVSLTTLVVTVGATN